MEEDESIDISNGTGWWSVGPHVKDTRVYSGTGPLNHYTPHPSPGNTIIAVQWRRRRREAGKKVLGTGMGRRRGNRRSVAARVPPVAARVPRVYGGEHTPRETPLSESNHFPKRQHLYRFAFIYPKVTVRECVRARARACVRACTRVC